jgi:hypothetical protein
MSTATQITDYAHRITYTASAGCTLGMMAVFTAATTVADGGAASDLGIGTFEATAVAGEQVSVLLYGPIVRVLVGTGGATRGTKAIHVADGYTDAPAHDSSGGTDNAIYGIFMETGVATDRIGMQQVAFNRGSA